VNHQIHHEKQSRLRIWSLQPARLPGFHSLFSWGVAGSAEFCVNAATSNVTAPSTIGQTVTKTWTGSIPPLTNASSNCAVLADTAAAAHVNATDVSQTKSQNGNSVSAANFREDVTVSRDINSSGVSLVKSKSGTGLPTLP
jgi:hypothetical protein